MFAVTTNGGELESALDVCRRPTPGGSTPEVFVNRVSPAQGLPRAQKVLMQGMPALHRRSTCFPSRGNEEGAEGGVVSGVVKGSVKFATASAKVIIEGYPAVRLNDTTLHNDGNAVGQVSRPSQTKVMVLS